jgi:outer membrane biosynthesis protein TonB
VQKPKPATREMPKPSKGTVDRGHSKPAAKPQQVNRPAAQPAQRPAAKKPAPSGNHGTAVSPNRGGQADRAASQRGKQSMPQGARSKGGGGGGGGGGNKKQKR